MTPSTTPAPGGTATLAGRPVARIGLGAMQLANPPGRPPVDREAAATVLRTAIEQGVNHIDTAEFYGGGAVNTLIRDVLHPYPQDLALVSKVGAEHTDTGLVPAQRPEQLRAGVEANLASLGVEQLAVVNLRRVDGGPGVVAEGDQRVDIDSQLAELSALRDEGKIGGIGLSAVTLDQLRHALPVGIACVQNSYSLLDRTARPLLDLCREHDIPWVPFFPLGSAFAHVPSVTDHPVVRSTAADLGVTPAQIGLAWLLAHYDYTLLIPGTANPAHLTDNLAAGDVKLAPDVVATLDAIASPETQEQS